MCARHGHCLQPPSAASSADARLYNGNCQWAQHACTQTSQTRGARLGLALAAAASPYVLRNAVQGMACSAACGLCRAPVCTSRLQASVCFLPVAVTALSWPFFHSVFLSAGVASGNAGHACVSSRQVLILICSPTRARVLCTSAVVVAHNSNFGARDGAPCANSSATA